MAHIPTDDYCAQRDSYGNIRLNCGRGLLIATFGTTRAEVQSWFDNVVGPKFAANYRAALNLFDREAQESAASPVEELRTQLKVTLRAIAGELRSTAELIEAQADTDPFDEESAIEAAIEVIRSGTPYLGPLVEAASLIRTAKENDARLNGTSQ